MRKNKRWLLIPAILVLGGLGYIVYSMLSHTSGDYLTISEVRLEASSFQDRQVSVGGKVAPGSVDWNGESKTLNFTLTDDSARLDMVYEGIAPDSFKPGAELIVTGKYGSDDVFRASSFGDRRSWCNACH